MDPTRTPDPAPAPADILVIGSINVDLFARVERHPRPGETVHGEGGELLPGGKGANQAVAAALLGGRVRMLGAVGEDPAAAVALTGLEAAGVDTRLVRRVPGPTGQAIVTVAADGENSIIVIPGANASVDAQRVRAHRDEVAGAGIVICQGEIPRDGVEEAARLARGRLLLNPAPVLPLSAGTFRRADPLVVNQHEAALVLRVLGCAEADVPAAPEAMLRALQDQGVRAAIITLGADGALVAEDGRRWAVPSARVAAVDTTGAGDAFIGALAVRLSCGDSLVDAAAWACRVGAAATTAAGAQPSYPSVGDPLPEPGGTVRARDQL